jgi:hypothetical protein
MISSPSYGVVRLRVKYQIAAAITMTSRITHHQSAIPPADGAAARFAAIIVAFAPLFRHRTWRHAEVLLVGAILAPGKRTVTSILRTTGLSRERHFVNYHRVLSRARWSTREAARLSLSLLRRRFVII